MYAHDLSRCILTLSIGAVSVTLQGEYGEQGAIKVGPAADRATKTVGLGGSVTIARINNPTGDAEISVRPGTAAYRDLAAMFDLQHPPAGGALPPMTFAYRNLGNGDEVIDPEAAFLADPSIDEGENSADRTFKIALPNYRTGRKLGTLATGR